MKYQIEPIISPIVKRIVNPIIGKNANDYSRDSSVVAVWPFNGVNPGEIFTKNIKSGFNNLVNVGDVDVITPAIFEGSSCALTRRLPTPRKYFSLAESLMSPDFPFKSDNSVRELTACIPLKKFPDPSDVRILGKWSDVISGWSFDVKQANLPTGQDKLVASFGHTGGTAFEELTFNGVFPANFANEVVLLTVRINDALKSCHIRSYNVTLDSLIHDSTQNYTNNIYIGTAPFNISRLGEFYIDETMISKRIMSNAEVDEIAQKTYRRIYQS